MTRKTREKVQQILNENLQNKLGLFRELNRDDVLYFVQGVLDRSQGNMEYKKSFYTDTSHLYYLQPFTVLNDIPQQFINRLLVSYIISCLDKDMEGHGETRMDMLEWYYRDNMIIEVSLMDHYEEIAADCSFGIIDRFSREKCQDEELLHEYLDNNVLFFKLFEHQPESCIRKALVKNAAMLSHIHNPTIEHQLIALENSYSISTWENCHLLQKSKDPAVIKEINRMKLLKGSLK